MQKPDKESPDLLREAMKPVIKDVLGELINRPSIRDLSNLENDVNPLETLEEDIKHWAQLARVAQYFRIDASEWEQKLQTRIQEVAATSIAVSHPILELTLEKMYSVYLLDTGRVEEAMEHIQQFRNALLTSAGHKFAAELIRFAGHLTRRGYVQQGQEFMDGLKPEVQDPNRWYGYYQIFFARLAAQNTIEEIIEWISHFQSHTTFEDYSITVQYYPSQYQALADMGRASLAQCELNDQNAEMAFAVATDITLSGARLGTYFNLLKSLVSTIDRSSDKGRLQAIVREQAVSILDYLDENSYQDELEEKQEILRLHRRGRSLQEDETEKEVSLRDHLMYKVKLAQILGNDPQLADIVQRCLTSALEGNKKLSMESSAQVREKLLHYFCRTNQLERAKEIFSQSLEMQPNFPEDRFEAAIQDVYICDAFLRDVTCSLDLLPRLHNCYQRMSLLQKYYFIQVSQQFNFLGWQEAVEEIKIAVQQEIQRYAETAVDEEMDEEEDEEADEYLPSFSNVTYFIKDVAKLAFQKGNIGVFQDAIHHNDLLPEDLADVLNDIWEWMNFATPLEISVDSVFDRDD